MSGSVAPPPDEVSRYWPAALVAGIAVLLAVGWLLLRRRSVGAIAAVAEGDDKPTATARPPVARARLAMTLRPIRAGLNLLSATSENEIVVVNTGGAAADDIHIAVALVSAHAGQDAELATLHAAPIGRSAVPPFALQPGEQRAVTIVAALPREAIRSLTAAGRPMFVPIVSVNLVYATAGVAGQLARAFAIGVERVDSPKLAPFWLDVPPRSFDQVAARAHVAPAKA